MTRHDDPNRRDVLAMLMAGGLTAVFAEHVWLSA
jgi:hypothetical protein